MLPPPLPPLGERDPGDAWVEGSRWPAVLGTVRGRRPSGLGSERGDPLAASRRLEPFRRHLGSAGRRRKQGESAEAGALREAAEEARVPADKLRILHTSVHDLGFWSYTTVIAWALEPFEAVVADHESNELRWVPVDEVEALPLHPGFAAAWPELRTWLR